MRTEREAPAADRRRARKGGRRNVVIVLSACAALVAVTALLAPLLRPPVRCIVFIANESPATVEVQAPDGPREIGPGGFARVELRPRTKESLPLQVRSLDLPPLTCTVGKGVYLVNATGEGRVGFETIQYGEESMTRMLLSSRVVPVGRECRKIAEDPSTVLYEFADPAPPAISVERRASDLPRWETRLKLWRRW